MSSSPIEPTPAAAGREAEEAAAIVQVAMPQMGISVAEGTILEWRKRTGDWVEADETICDVSTDKVDVEIPAPVSGRLAKLCAEPGDTLAVGETIAEIDTAAQAGEAHPDESSSGAARPAGPVTEWDPPSPAPPALLGDGPPHSVPPAGDSSERDRSGFYSPVVRRLADEHGVDLEQVEGTGVGGRVKKSDVVAFLESEGAGEAKVERALHSESPYKPEPEPAPTDADELFGPTRRAPLSPMRRQIARHMVESRRTSAHCTTIVEVDFSRVAERRAELRDAMERRGVNLTYLAFVAGATVAALGEHPILNASIEDEEVVHHEDVNLGIAVALEDGLIVPVIRKAQRLSLEGIAAAIADVATRAREKRLHPDEVQGGTFTITNPGQFGAVLATPIINQPQVAILDLEAVVKRPVVVEQDGGDAIAIRPMSFLCMSWDHRALDGAEAAKFLAAIRGRLEGWVE